MYGGLEQSAYFSRLLYVLLSSLSSPELMKGIFVELQMWKLMKNKNFFL